MTDTIRADLREPARLLQRKESQCQRGGTVLRRRQQLVQRRVGRDPGAVARAGGDQDLRTAAAADRNAEPGLARFLAHELREIIAGREVVKEEQSRPAPAQDLARQRIAGLQLILDHAND